GGEAGSWLALRILVAREPVEDEVPRRRRAAASVHGVEVLRPREPVAALHCARLRRRAACDHARAAASGWRDRRGRTSALGTRDAASGAERSVGRCVSRRVLGLRAGAGEYRRTAPMPRFPQSRGDDSQRKLLLLGRSCLLIEQRPALHPHLWTAVWKKESPCKMPTFS